MRILVLGAGTVGTSIAELLCQHGHSVNVVDIDAGHCRRMNESLDLKAITGSASRSTVLFQANAMNADLCLAVTGDDEVNLVAASMAKAMGARRTVSRAYAPVFHDASTFDYQRHFKIDRLLSIEHLSAMELAHSIRQSGSLVMENFAHGELEMRELIVSEKIDTAGKLLKDLELPPGVRIGVIQREEHAWIAGATDHIEVGDHITLVGRVEDIDDVSDRFQKKSGSKQSIVIAGGGETGYHLAKTLEKRRFHVVLMDADPERCSGLANNLKNTTVINCDATSRRVLEEERVGSADVFVACTGDDENNIMACVEAQEIGAKRRLAIVSRPDYANIVGKLGIDLAVSPREVVAQAILGFLNVGSVISRIQLGEGSIQAIEIEVAKDTPVTEHVLANLDLPNSFLIAAVINEEYVHVPGADDRLKPGDTVIALMNKSVEEDALKLFDSGGQ